jgi:hypothetical protein
MSREIHSSGKVLRVSVIVGGSVFEERLVALNELPVMVNEDGTIELNSLVIQPLFTHDETNQDIGHALCLPDCCATKLNIDGKILESGGGSTVVLTKGTKGRVKLSGLLAIIFQFVSPPQGWLDNEKEKTGEIPDLYSTLID